MITYSISLFNYRFMDPLANGDYPKNMRALVRSRLPKFTKEQSKQVKGSFDFKFNYIFGLLSFLKL